VSEDSDPKLGVLGSRIALLEALQQRRYRFITPTPATHARVVARRRTARDLRDVLGWSLPFDRDAVEPEIVALLEAAEALDEQGGLLKSRLRVSSLDDDLFLHSAFPTTQQDSVFFGPDSYRFAAFLRQELPRFGKRERIVDIGAGTGVGAITAMRVMLPAWDEGLISPTILFSDINPKALELAMANAFAAAIPGACLFRVGDGIPEVDGRAFDLVIANPPYIADPAHRAYRDGGAMHGGEVSLAWARAAAQRLERGGAFLLYTGSAIVDGRDDLKGALLDALAGFEVSYREIDPDVFGEELDREDYADVERIAAVGLVAVKR
jgi:methylase of polypeptide subunit release factors